MLKTTGVDINTLRFGNPTCPYCGVTYPMVEDHNCVFSQDAKLKAERERADKAEAELLKARMNLRDQFAMHLIPSLMLRWKEPGYTEAGAVAEAYAIADLMMECRVI